MVGKGITEESTFIQRALSLIREFMEDDGKAFVYQRFIAPSSLSVSFSKALNRSVTGSMNELAMAATAQLETREIAPQIIGRYLNDFLLSTIAPSKQARYGKPMEAFRLLVHTHERST